MENSSSSSRTPLTSPLLLLQTQPFSLPASWAVEEVPRSDGCKSDKYYIEPESGRRFRSLREVERHLNGETVTRRRRSTALIASHRPETSRTSREESSFIVSRPPPKVNWVLASHDGDAWNPIVPDTFISDSVKQQWSRRFMVAMNNHTSAAVTPTEQEQLMEQPQAAENIQQGLSMAENIQQSLPVDGGVQEEGGLRRSSRSNKKVAYHRLDFVYD